MNLPTRSTLVFLLLLLSIVVAQAQRGARTKPISLDELTMESTQVVRGTIVSARVEPHPVYNNLMTVVVTVRVEKTLKGAATQKLEFRQFVWDARDFKDGAIYRRGDSMVLMLGAVSPYGLRSPVGLGQGRFRIHKDSSGQEFAVNESGNAALFSSAKAKTGAAEMRLSTGAASMVKENRGGPMRVDDLETLIQGYAKNSSTRSAQ